MTSLAAIVILSTGCIFDGAFDFAPSGGTSCAFRLVVCSYPRLVVGPSCDVPVNVAPTRGGRYGFALDTYTLKWSPRKCVLDGRTLSIVSAAGTFDTSTGEIDGHVDLVGATGVAEVVPLHGCESRVQDVAYFSCHEPAAEPPASIRASAD